MHLSHSLQVSGSGTADLLTCLTRPTEWIGSECHWNRKQLSRVVQAVGGIAMWQIAANQTRK